MRILHEKGHGLLELTLGFAIVGILIALAGPDRWLFSRRPGVSDRGRTTEVKKGQAYESNAFCNIEYEDLRKCYGLDAAQCEAMFTEIKSQCPAPGQQGHTGDSCVIIGFQKRLGAVAKCGPNHSDTIGQEPNRRHTVNLNSGMATPGISEKRLNELRMAESRRCRDAEAPLREAMNQKFPGLSHLSCKTNADCTIVVAKGVCNPIWTNGENPVNTISAKALEQFISSADINKLCAQTRKVCHDRQGELKAVDYERVNFHKLPVCGNWPFPGSCMIRLFPRR